MDIRRKRIFDSHTHIGALGPYRYYGLPEPVNPTVIEYHDTQEYLKEIDSFHIDRVIALPNYGLPDSAQPFSLQPLVMDAMQKDDRMLGGLWVSLLPKDRERVIESLKLAGEPGIKVLKMTCLLGGTWDPGQWDEATQEQAELIVSAAEQHDFVIHIHTSPGGNSDISKAIPFVEKYGKRAKIHLVHMGGGVSGHIKLVPKFIEMVQQGFKVYTDCTWAVGFGPRFLLTEIERTGVGGDRVLFSSDLPWSDFMGEYWKIEGAHVSDELKENVFWRNAEKLYGGR
jgi:uncharacterized protein